MTELPATNRAERRAISMAGCAPSDIGVAEVHDFNTRTELISYEDVGFAEPAAVSAVTIPEGPVTDGR
jgi:acetyl-CoA C-acetyltransferase